MATKLLGKDGFYGWINLAVICLFNVALMPLMMAFAFFLPSWVNEFGWSRGLASGAQTLSTILMGLTAPLAALFIMRRGAKQAIAVGNLICVAGLVLLAFQNHIWELYLGFGVLLGLGISIGGMLAMMTVLNNWFIVKRPVAISISMASTGFSGVFVQPSMMALISAVGWRNTYLILAATALLFCVIVPALLIRNKPEDLGQVPDGPVPVRPETARSGSSPQRNLYKTPVDFTAREALRTVTLWLLIAYSALRFLAMMGIQAHIIAFQFDIGISATTAGMIGGFYSAVMFISQLGIGFVGLRFKMHTLIVVAAIFGMVGVGVLLFAHSVLLMLAYCIFYGISTGIGSVAVQNLFPDYYGRTEFPKIMGYTMPFNTFIGGLGAPFAGYIRDVTGSYAPAFRIMFASLVIAFFCVLFAKPPLHPSLTGKAQDQKPEAQLVG